MSEMIERVARAMCEAADDDWDWSVFYIVDVNDTVETGRDVYRDMARAAIEAMIPFLREAPNTILVETGQRDPHFIWDDAADSQREAILGYVQAALKEQA